MSDEASLAGLRVDLRTFDEVRMAQARIRKFAAELGFDRRSQWQVTIAASEASTNMVKYAGGGCLWLAALESPRRGLRLEARDFGPGIRDLARAFEDHISEGCDARIRERFRDAPRGLGTGLGAIARMMDDLGWENLADGGLLWAEKYLRASEPTR